MKICRYCGEDIELDSVDPQYADWWHVDTKLYTCGHWAEPEDDPQTGV